MSHYIYMHHYMHFDSASPSKTAILRESIAAHAPKGTP